MKELSIEAKAKAYDEAVINGSRLWECGEITRENYEYIFPELCESEDERMMNQLHRWMKEFGGAEEYTEKVYQWLRCLIEKQGEHANFINKIQIGDKVTRNKDGVLVNLSQLKRVAKKDEKQGEQKPVSITDEWIENYWQHEKVNNPYSSVWSEEDERNLQGIIDEIEANKNAAPDYDLTTYDRFLSWLKSLKDRYIWKPSDAQMDSITCAVRKMKESACYDSELVSLFNDLKKLREE